LNGTQVVFVQNSTEIEKTIDSPISAFGKALHDFSKGAEEDPKFRVRVRGKIKQLSDSYFTLTTPRMVDVRVRRIEKISLSINEEVEVTGFLDTSQGFASIRYPLVLTEEYRGQGNSFLESVSAVRTLPRTIAGLQLPVKMKALVTYIDSTNYTLFIHDEAMGIFGLATPSELLQGVGAGDRIQIVGKTDPGEFAPIVTIDELEILGKGTFPPARALTETDLVTGSADGQWVKEEGIVNELVESRVSKHFQLTKYDGTEIGVHVPRTIEEDDLRNLRGKKIRVKGVGGSIFTTAGRFMSVHVWAPNLDFIEVIEESSIVDYGSANIDRNQILKFNPDPNISEPVKLEGKPVYQFPNGEFYLFSNGYYLVRPRTKEILDLEKNVEVLGVARPSLKVPIISQARWQQNNTLDKSNELRVYNLNSSDFCNFRLGRTVRAEGIIGDVSIVSGNRLILLNLPSGDVLQLVLSRQTSRSQALETGSNISVTGVCHSSLDDSEDDLLSIMSESFVVLRSADDIQLIAGPPFWTVGRISIILGLALSVFLLALLWVALLRRRVSGQTQVISQKLKEAEELKDAALAADAAKSEFLANMSHEIRTPLTSVLGFSELLSVDGDKETKELAELIKKGGERLMRTLTSVLEIAELQKNSRTSAFAPVDISQLIQDLHGSLEIKALQKGIQLESSCNPEGLKLNTDKAALERVLTNLSSNAITYSPSGTTVILSAFQGDRSVVFRVQDEGIGMSDEFKSQMFEPFTQESKGEARQYEGSGLGLSIAQKLVQLLGGKIEVESTKGVGTEFIVRIPMLDKGAIDEGRPEVVSSSSDF